MVTSKLERNDVAIAHKAINLAPGLSGVDKAVACAILDHFNKKTGQCDPSNGRIGELLAIDERTVRRATSELCGEIGFFKKTSHGGKSARASYTPQWSVFRKIVADWDRRMKTGSGPKSGNENRAKSPGEDEDRNRAKPPGSMNEFQEVEQGKTVRQTGRFRPVEQGEIALQTHLRNPSYEPIGTTEASEYAAVRQNAEQMAHWLSKGNVGLLKEEKPKRSDRAAIPGCSRKEAARQAAQRRVNEAVGCADREWQSDLWTLTEPADWDAAVEAEQRHRGEGIGVLRMAVQRARLRTAGGARP